MFNLSIDTKITKEYLLKQNSEETYMSYYLGVPVKKGLFVSPLRADKHKTCSFFRGKSGNLYFKDFATNQCLDFINVVMAMYNCTYHQALRIIAKDFGYISGTIPKVKSIKEQPKFESDKQTFIQVELKDFSESELKWWGTYGITKEMLAKFNVHSCKTVFLNGNIYAQSSQHSPIYGYYFGKKEGIEQWRIYMPKAKNFPRFIGNVSTKTIQGYKQLPKNGKLLVITKSMKDVISLHSYGITAIAPNSETQWISDKVLEDLKSRFNRIVVMYDNDLPGISNMNKIKKLHPELTYFFIPKNLNCKDFSDLRAMYGYEDTKNLIINTLKQWQKSRKIQAQK